MSAAAPPLEDVAQRAITGDQHALQELVRQIQDPLHRLATRMLANPEDALEATQEILIRIVTKLSTFKGDSAFMTWAYKVASNYLLSARKSLAKEQGLTFEVFEQDLLDGLVDEAAENPEDAWALKELRIRCTMALLLCLDRPHRIAYVLGEILETDHREAAIILDVSAATYRKRLSRAREKVQAATQRNCGIVNDAAPCSCPRRLPRSERLGRVDRRALVYAHHDAPSQVEVMDRVRVVEQSLRTLVQQRATGPLRSPKDFGEDIAKMTAIQA